MSTTKKQRRVLTWFTFDPAMRFERKNELASDTVPDQTMSLAHLLLNFTRDGGMHHGVKVRDPLYSGDDEVLSTQALDLVDKQEIAEANAERILMLSQRRKQLHELSNSKERKALADKSTKPVKDADKVVPDGEPASE